MGLKCGIVGLPNVGKSTIFNALTKAGIAAENYPFCTIEPNVGVVEVPDPRLKALSEIVHPERVVPAAVEFVDIAGLVAGASKGEGLGNQFLANIRECDAIAHIVRCFTDDNIVHVSGKVDPLDDINVINTELALADLQTVEKALNRYSKQARSGGDKEALKLVLVLEKLLPALNEGRAARSVKLTPEEIAVVRPLFLLTIKPTMYVANVEDHGFENNPLLDAVREFAASEHSPVVAVCAKTEADIADLDDEDKEMFLADMGMTEPGLDRVIRAGYDLLGLQTYFTAGVKEVRAWTIHKGDTAPQAAGVIHTDFERGFIRAQTIAYEDFIAFKGEKGAQEAGKMRAEGKDYIVQDGDVMNFNGRLPSGQPPVFFPYAVILNGVPTTPQPRCHGHDLHKKASGNRRTPPPRTRTTWLYEAADRTAARRSNPRLRTLRKRRRRSWRLPPAPSCRLRLRRHVHHHGRTSRARG